MLGRRCAADGGDGSGTTTEGALVHAAASSAHRTEDVPLAVDATSRYLVDQFGDPWLGVGDIAWSLVGQLTVEDIAGYLDDRADKGVNLVLLSVPEPYYADDDPRNAYGDPPFVVDPFQSPLNDAYWDVVDFAVEYAAALGITLLICPIYIGWGGDGWQEQLEAATNDQMAEYGELVAKRYGQAPNIMWLLGHDKEALSADLKARGSALVQALRANTGDLVTAASNRQRDVNGTNTFGIGSEEWASSGVEFDFDTQYDYSGWIAENLQRMWELSPPRPFTFLDGQYEQQQPSPPLPVGDVLLREQMWASFCNGATAQIWGNNPIWGLGSQRLYTPYSGTWQDNLGSDGSLHLAKFAEITSAIGEGWATTKQDSDAAFVTTPGSGSDRIAARFDDDLGILYHPNFAAGSIVVDLGKFATNWSTVTITRYDPTSGEAVIVGEYPTEGGTVIDAPPVNAYGDNDWLFVVSGAVGQQHGTTTP